MLDAPQAFDVARLTKQEHVAIKMLAKGEASADQQVLVLEVVIKKLSRAFDMPYIPGSFDQSSFLAGRAYVGQQLLKYTKLPAGKQDE